jgi:PAS domain S-box-containing protein
MFGLRSARSRAIAAAVLCLLLLAGVATTAAADRVSDIALWHLIGLSAAAFALAVATIAGSIVSTVRPLAALRASAGAITSGDMKTRVEACGPEGVVSLTPGFTQMADALSAEALRERLLHDMAERIKELTCIYRVASSGRVRETIDEIVQDVVAAIPPAWHYPEIARARVCLDGREYVSEHFEEASWKQSSDIVVNGEKQGTVEVHYLEERPEADEGPFLREERNLIDGIARILSETIERKRAEEELAKHRQNLAELVEERTAELQLEVTERKEAEEALRESEERFRDIAENAVEWIWEVDTDGKYTYASPVVEEVLGYEPDEVLEKHFYDLFYPEDREELGKAAFGVFAQKRPFRGFINRCVHKSGKTVWLSTSGVPILDEEGNLLGYRGADTDITERKRAEEALRRREQEVRVIADNVPALFSYVDADGCYRFVNKRYEEFFGIPPTQIIGKHLRDVLGEATYDEIKGRVETALSSVL